MQERQQDVPRIMELIDEVKSQYTQYGGDVRFYDIKDDKVRIETLGYCHR